MLALERLLQYSAVQEHERVQGLILRGRCHNPLDCQVRQERLDFRGASREIGSTLHLMKLHVATNPIAEGALGTQGVVVNPHHISDLIQQFFGLCAFSHFDSFNDTLNKNGIFPVFTGIVNNRELFPSN